MNKPNFPDGHISNSHDPRKPPGEKTTLSLHSSRISLRASNFLICISILFLHHAAVLLGHPQCLDYGPPFQPPFHLEFCSAYETFGCCEQEKDNQIAAKYWDIMDYIDPQAQKLCGGFIKDILCQVTCLVCTTGKSRFNLPCCNQWVNDCVGSNVLFIPPFCRKKLEIFLDDCIP